MYIKDGVMVNPQVYIKDTSVQDGMWWSDGDPQVYIKDIGCNVWSDDVIKDIGWNVWSDGDPQVMAIHKCTLKI